MGGCRCIFDLYNNSRNELKTEFDSIFVILLISEMQANKQTIWQSKMKFYIFIRVLSSPPSLILFLFFNSKYFPNLKNKNSLSSKKKTFRNCITQYTVSLYKITNTKKNSVACIIYTVNCNNEIYKLYPNPNGECKACKMKIVQI